MLYAMFISNVMELSMIPAVYTDPRITYFRQQRNNYNSDYAEFKVLDVETIKADIVDCLGAILARCWLDKQLMAELRSDPHYCLLQQGMILPKCLDIQVETHRGTNRPQVVVYEIKDDIVEKVCSLRMSMLASIE
jgi:hypothetical protein